MEQGKNVLCEGWTRNPTSSWVDNPGFSGKHKDNLVFLPRNSGIVECGPLVYSRGREQCFIA